MTSHDVRARLPQFGHEVRENVSGPKEHANALPALGSTPDSRRQEHHPMGKLSHVPPSPAGHPADYRTRCAVARSLLGHRTPSAQLCSLVVAVLQGMSLVEVAELDAATRPVR